MRAIRFALVAALLAAAMTAVGQAAVLGVGDTVNVGYLNYDSPYNISTNSGGSYSSVGAGLFELQAKSGSSPITYSNVVQVNGGGGIASFCIDLKEHIAGYPSTNTFQVISLDLAPNESSGPAPMGSAKATMIEQLWRGFINTDGGSNAPGASTIDNVSADVLAGFQLAVWEIEYETSSFGLTTGLFRADQSGTIAGAVAEANYMLNTWLPANPNAATANLVALSNPTDIVSGGYQDQVIELYGAPGAPNVPEPATILIWAIMFSAAACINGNRLLKH